MLETNQQSEGEISIQLDLIQEHLQDLTPDEIISFDSIFRELVYNAYDWKLWAAAYIVNGGCSDDCFMDFRGWLVAQGEEVYTKALKDPETLSEIENLEEDMEWEGYAYIASSVYEQKTGEELPNNTNLIHPDVPTGEQWDEDELDDLLPKLSEKYGW